jgi:hypothetical protein
MPMPVNVEVTAVPEVGVKVSVHDPVAPAASTVEVMVYAPPLVGSAVS